MKYTRGLIARITALAYLYLGKARQEKTATLDKF